MSRGISVTQIQRWISTANRLKRERRNEELIQAQAGQEKDMLPEQSLVSVDFNKETRVAHVVFEETQMYRTIDRYVTQNYVKYPIYSSWKTKCKTIKKTLKLTNERLEDLHCDSDRLVRIFANDIIAALNDDSLYPAWFIMRFYADEYKEKLSTIEQELNSFLSIEQGFIQGEEKEIKRTKDKIEAYKLVIQKTRPKYYKYYNKVDRIENAYRSVIKYIVSFGAYAYVVSKTRKSRLIKKRDSHKKTIDSAERSISEREEKIEELKKEISDAKAKIDKKKEETEKIKAEEYKAYYKKIKSVKPLEKSAQTNEFFPLKSFAGMAYQKVVGCYIIRNKENGRCYVGQSKDVYKRIKQHFRGTVPNNIIFAEDYYSSKNKEDLFEIMIIPKQTKDELDETERILIEEYQARAKGYNGTSGNT